MAPTWVPIELPSGTLIISGSLGKRKFWNMPLCCTTGTDITPLESAAEKMGEGQNTGFHHPGNSANYQIRSV